MRADEAAGVTERFLSGTSLYPHEWNGFVETPQSDNSRTRGLNGIGDDATIEKSLFY